MLQTILFILVGLAFIFFFLFSKSIMHAIVLIGKGDDYKVFNTNFISTIYLYMSTSTFFFIVACVSKYLFD